MNDIITNDEAFSASVKKVRDLVACTAGPYGKNVQFFNGYPITLRDGLRVMTDFTPNDPMTSNVLIRMRQRAKNVVDRAGDGTTTMTVLMAAIYKEAMELIAGKPGISRRGVAEGIRVAAESAIADLKSMALSVDRTDEGRDLVLKVATVAAGNNAEIGRKVTDLMWELGGEGTVHTEYSEGIREIEIEKVDGFTLPGGAYDAAFVAQGNGKVVLENPVILVIREHIQRWEEIAPMMKAWAESLGTRPILICCANFTGSSISTLIRNHTEQRRPIYVVGAAPEYGSYLQDLASCTGAMYFSKNAGGLMLDDFTKAGVAAFGTCAKATITMRETVFTGLSGENKAIAGSFVQSQILEGMDDAGKTKLESRLSNINGQVGIVKVPLTTMGEASFLKEVVDDSYLAARSAIRSGVLPGAGRAFVCAQGRLSAQDWSEYSTSFRIGVYAVEYALSSVTEQLCKNGGIDPMLVLNRFRGDDLGKYATVQFNDKTLSLLSGPGDVPASDEYASVFGHAVAIGVLDSAAVQMVALENAANEAAEWVATEIFVMPSVS